MAMGVLAHGDRGVAFILYFAFFHISSLPLDIADCSLDILVVRSQFL